MSQGAGETSTSKVCQGEPWDVFLHFIFSVESLISVCVLLKLNIILWVLVQLCVSGIKWFSVTSSRVDALIGSEPSDTRREKSAFHIQDGF